jgi:hypothetical protein
VAASGSASGPAKPLVPPDDGTVDAARWYAREGARLGATMLDERHQAERIQTRCAFCTETFDGTFRDGRAWFAQHRASVHPELAEPPERRRSRKRLAPP